MQACLPTCTSHTGENTICSSSDNTRRQTDKRRREAEALACCWWLIGRQRRRVKRRTEGGSFLCHAHLTLGVRATWLCVKKQKKTPPTLDQPRMSVPDLTRSSDDLRSAEVQGGDREAVLSPFNRINFARHSASTPSTCCLLCHTHTHPHTPCWLDTTFFLYSLYFEVSKWKSNATTLTCPQAVPERPVFNFLQEPSGRISSMCWNSRVTVQSLCVPHACSAEQRPSYGTGSPSHSQAFIST